MTEVTMAKEAISKELKETVADFLAKNREADLISTYLFFVERKFNLNPVLYPKKKKIYQSASEAAKELEAAGELWREAEIKVGIHPPVVNDQTTKIYICPFTGKVFGDNTHPNPQDAIYDWVSTCPENKERVGGLRVKRFFVSEDPEVIRNYIGKTPLKEPITKKVFSSVLSGKLFGSREGVIEDFKQNYLKRLTLGEVQSQNSYAIEDHFLSFIQQQLVEDKITQFVEALSEFEEFTPFVQQWLE